MKIKNIFQNQKGMALLMVITSVALMTIVLADLTFETQLNKIKIYNLQDRLQAKMNAEAGLRFAMAKLKLYQQAMNLIAKDENVKQVIRPSSLEAVVTSPFMIPVPELNTMSLSQRNALAEFNKNNLLRGNLNVSMQSVSGFLNPNNMRVFKQSTTDPNDPDNPQNDPNQNDPNDPNAPSKSPQKYIEEKLVERLRTIMDAKREQDDLFDAKYGNLREEMLIKELKYFVMDKGDFDDPEIADIDSLYSGNNIEAKHAPLTSIDELYLLQGWPDEIVNLIINDLSVHEVSVIQVNNINKDQLRIIFPDITEIQIEEFFKYRDGDPQRDEDPRPFKDEQDFKSVVTNFLGIISAGDYDQRIKELANAGLQIGVAGKLFRVESIGSYERAVYTIVAFVDLPIKPTPKKKKKANDPQNNVNDSDEIDNFNDPNDPNNPNEVNNTNKTDKKDKEPPREFLEPRVIEVRAN